MIDDNAGVNSTQFREPYIRTQKVHVLTPGRLSLLDVLSDYRHLLEPHNAEGHNWRTLGTDPNRCGTDDLFEEFKNDRSHRFLCVVNEAGMGKSTALRRGQRYLMDQDKDLLVLVVNVESIFGEKDLFWTLRVTVRKELQEAQTVDAGMEFAWLLLDDDEQDAYLRSKLKWQKLIILFDGLDHVSMGEGVDDRIIRIREFIEGNGARAKIGFSGRPYAVGHTLSKLDLEGSCLLAQMAYFDVTDQRDFLSNDCFEKLRQMDAGLIRIPRALKHIRFIYNRNPSALNDLRNSTDIYDQCVHALMKEGFQGRIDDWSKAFRIFSVIAFQTLIDGLPSLTPTELTEGYLNRRVYELHKERLQPEYLSYDLFAQKVIDVRSINEGWSHSFLEHVGLENGIYWRDKSLRDYFAACWVLSSRKSSNCGQTLLHKTLECLHGADITPNSSEFYWTWRFLSESSLDEGANWIRPNAETWVAAFRPLYAQIATPSGSKVGIEFVGRSHKRMQALAGASGRISTAAAVLAEFQSHFAELLGTSGHDSTAWRLMNRFIELKGEPGLFLLDFPVTHREFALFDANRRIDNPESLDCPATGISFFDAEVFCLWIGNQFVRTDQMQGSLGRYSCRLPRHSEWVKACLAGSQNNEFANVVIKGTERSLEEGTVVDYYRLDSPQPYRSAAAAAENAWGYKDTHGNVWEWIEDTGSGPKRRICGGSFRSQNPSEVSAAFHYEVQADRRDSDIGMRPILERLGDCRDGAA